MTTAETKDKLWEKVREYNQLSHIYSDMADELTHLAQELEDE